MGGDVLSQAEVESLLSAMDNTAPVEQKPVSTFKSPRITPYNFKRPERVGKGQMRALQALHEGFGRNFAAGLSAMLRSVIEVKLTSVEQLTYSEFVFSLENPTCFNLLKAAPLEGNLILDISPSILYPIIDRLLGSGRKGGALTRRPLTEIELRLVSRITNLFLAELKHAWENVLDLELEVVRVESNPQLVQIVPPNEVVVLISFELTINDVRGMMNLCIPYNSIEHIGQIGNSPRNSLVEVKVGLAGARISTGDLLGLRVGDIITTEKDVRSAFDVTVEGVKKFLARPGAFKGHRAISIEEIVPIDEELQT